MNENIVQILGSPLGMYSLLREDFIISILKDDGSLDLNKLNNMVWTIANMGATGIRDFFWIDTEEAYKRISPFWRKDDGSYEFNGRYFDHQRSIATLCNKYGVRYYLSIFDHCGTKRKKNEETGVWQWNPWRFFKDYFYGDDAAEMRHMYIDRILEAFNGLDAGIEVCNEPKSRVGDFLGDTFVYLVRRGFTPERIIIGIDYHLKEKDKEYGNDYRTLRNAAIKGLEDENWDQWLKSRCISPVHNATVEEIDHLWKGEAGPGGTRRILYSQDGVQNPRPNKDTMFRLAKKVLSMKTEARGKGKVHFEIVYGKKGSDPLDSIAGVTEAYNAVMGCYPETFGKFPQPLPLPDSEGLVTPSPDPLTTAIVESGYLGILGRQADPGGRDGYINFLKSGGTVIEFCRKLMDSDEYRTYRAGLPAEQLVAQLYKGVLNRNPDPGGMEHSLVMIRSGQFAERTVGMLDSMEFKSRFGL